MANITPAIRKKIENRIYDTLDIVDKSKTNSNYYRKIFKDMSDAQFLNLMKSDFPLRFHHVPAVVEPTMSDCIKALKSIGVPLIEPISLPYVYKNKNGEPVYSHPCIVVYIHLKKVQQFVTHKNSVAENIKSRDMKTGLLTYDDKGGKQSDRETAGLLALGMNETVKELTTFRADAMDSKSDAYNIISNTGVLHMKDLNIKQSEFKSKQLLDTYITASMGISNLISPSYETKYTLERKSKREANK